MVKHERLQPLSNARSWSCPQRSHLGPRRVNFLEQKPTFSLEVLSNENLLEFSALEVLTTAAPSEFHRASKTTDEKIDSQETKNAAPDRLLRRDARAPPSPLCLLTV